MSVESDVVPLASLPLFADDLDTIVVEANTAPAPGVLLRQAGTSPTSVPGLATPVNGHTPTPSGFATTPAHERTVSQPTGELDWSLVNAFRARASTELTKALQARESMTSQAQRELGRTIIFELLDASAQENQLIGRPTFSLGEQQRMAEAVYDALFGLGRLQPLVDNDQVENIIITGCDNVRLELFDGTVLQVSPVAESDEELIEFLVFLASRSEVNARPFSESQPGLDLRLDGGFRLAAAAWVMPRPSVVIRRQRLREVTLDDLVARNTLSPVAASFLRAAVRAKKSIVVAGAQGAGKTTMVRALCAEIGPWEALGTFETEYELHLHELPDRHPIVHAWEARPGSGELRADGRRAGEFTLEEALHDSFRFNLSRQIVGEVRGREVLAMIQAMQSGAGSISTTHAATALRAIRKLITCAMEAGAGVTEAYATHAITENIDIIVQLHLETTPTASGQPHRDRWVSEIIVLHPGEKEKGYSTTHVFRPVEGGPAVPSVLPVDYQALERYGFDIDTFTREATLP